MASRSAATAMLLSLPHMTVSARIQVATTFYRLDKNSSYEGPSLLPTFGEKDGGLCPPSHVSPILSITDTLEKGAMYREQAQAPLRT